MNLQNIDHHFCEGKITGKMPELFNAYSSLVISLYSLYGIFINTINIDKDCVELPNTQIVYLHANNQFIIKLMYSILYITGIGSFGYHWTEQVGWAFMDEMPMIVSLCIGVLYIENTLFNLKTQKVYNSLFLINSEYIYNFKLLFFTSIMIIGLVCNTSITYRNLFPYYFAILLIYMCYIFWCVLVKFVNTEYFTTSNTNHCINYSSNIIYLGNTSLYLLLTSVVIWAVTELGCDYTHNSILLLGHPLWHILIGYVFYNIIQIVYYINLYHQYMILKKFDYNPHQPETTVVCENIELSNDYDMSKEPELYLTYNSYYLLTITYKSHKYKI